MNTSLQKSFDRAISLLRTPHDYDGYLSIKIQPVNGGCCCFHCWPKTWANINEHITSFGQLKDEGDILIDSDGEKFVLECHESGPEIIVYLGLAAASITLIKSIIDFVNVILNALSDEPGKQSLKLKISSRRQIKGLVAEEKTLEIDLPLDHATTKKLSNNIKNMLEKKNN